MKFKLTTLLFIFISTILFAQKDWETLAQDSYVISYPKDWVSSDQKPQPSMQFLLLSDLKSQENDQFRENINLTIEDLGAQTIDLDGYAKLSLDQITSQIPSAKVLSNASIKLDNWDAKAITWTADFGNMVLKFKQLFLISGTKAYVLTFSSTTAEYDTYIEIGDKILNSFTLAK